MNAATLILPVMSCRAAIRKREVSSIPERWPSSIKKSRIASYETVGNKEASYFHCLYRGAVEIIRARWR
eukprot:scaffold2043_cov149-Skeletonema_menzelii.AAC.12